LSFRHRILLTGGGTGGHIYPALAVAERLKTDDSVESILYIGAAGHPEERLAKEQGLEFIGLSVSGLPRKLSPKLFAWPSQFLQAVNAARRVIEQFQPTIVLGTGGYASGPPLTAALLSQRKIAIHEPDAHPGLANRVFARYAQLISLGMGSAKERLGVTGARVVVNGNPVSKRFLSLPEKHAAQIELGLEPGKTTVLITGGSQGALALNNAVYELLPMLQASGKQWQVIHQVGEKNWQSMESSLSGELRQSSFYKPRPYFDHLEVAYAACDITVCRAGAMTIAELFVTGTPAIFVPYPFAAQDHQTFNARYVEAQGGAKVLVQSELDGKRLFELLSGLTENSETLLGMRKQMLAMARPEAAADLADQLKRIGRQGQ
jgi:UDP-N-acetylglucosamine--N-acetylmuramyl-(pentapeptide) pyrophosphoryl-undecaprenol N-acetylglucosamine transferase